MQLKHETPYHLFTSIHKLSFGAFIDLRNIHKKLNIVAIRKKKHNFGCVYLHAIIIILQKARYS